MSAVGVAYCLRIASAPPGRLEREPVAMVTMGLQTSEKDELVAGCGLLALRCCHVTGTRSVGLYFTSTGRCVICLGGQDGALTRSDVCAQKTQVFPLAFLPHSGNSG